MPTVSFQSPVYASPAFASARPQPVKASVHALPQCHFGGGKFPAQQNFTLLQKIKNIWEQVKFALKHVLKKNTLSKERTHFHELGHMLSHYASSRRPLGITFNEFGMISGHVKSPKQSGKETINDSVKNLWNTLSGGIIGDLNILEKGKLQFKEGALAGMHGDMYSVMSIMKKLSFNNPKFDLLKTYINEMYSLDVEAIRAGKDLEGKKKALEIQEKISPIISELLFENPLKIAVNKLLKLKTAIKPEKLEQLRQGVLNKGGWMFGKTFRTQLYEKVFTAAERQQFEKIYQEYEREFLALPEIQALNAKQ